MAMLVEEWNELVRKAVESPDDSATVVSVLTQARDEYIGTYSEFVKAEKERDDALQEIDRLRKTNMDLFLRIGQATAEETGNLTNERNTQKSRAETITVEDLFKKEEK